MEGRVFCGEGGSRCPPGTADGARKMGDDSVLSTAPFRQPPLGPAPPKSCPCVGHHPCWLLWPVRGRGATLRCRIPDCVSVVWSVSDGYFKRCFIWIYFLVDLDMFLSQQLNQVMSKILYATVMPTFILIFITVKFIHSKLFSCWFVTCTFGLLFIIWQFGVSNLFWNIVLDLNSP